VFNFDNFKSGGLHRKHAVAAWNLGNHHEEGGTRKEPELLLSSEFYFGRPRVKIL
jgi:hypothetical protein